MTADKSVQQKLTTRFQDELEILMKSLHEINTVSTTGLIARGGIGENKFQVLLTITKEVDDFNPVGQGEVRL